MRRLSFLTLAFAAAIAACGGSSDAAGGTTDPGTGGNGGNNPPPPANAVNIMPDSTFSPNAINVSVGSTVTWVWPGCSSYTYGPTTTGCITHSVVFDDGSNISSTVQDSGTFSRTFATAGEFDYHCGVHGATMAGKVVVQ